MKRFLILLLFSLFFIPFIQSAVIITIDESSLGNTLTQTVNIFTNGSADTNATTACTGSQVLFGNGSCGVVAGTGDITGVFGDQYITNGSGSGDVNLVFNDTLLNITIDARAGSNVNVFNQDLNTTSNVNFGNISSSGNITINGVNVCQEDGTNCQASAGGNVFDQDLNTTSNVSFGNVTSSSWFNGLFNWTVNSVSSIYLQFNGNELTFNESQLNSTIDNRAGGNVNVFDQELNTTQNVSFGNVSLVKDGFFNGLFNWTEISIYLSFNGNTLDFNESQLNDTIDDKVTGASGLFESIGGSNVNTTALGFNTTNGTFSGLLIANNITTTDTVIARLFQGLFSWIINTQDSSTVYLNFNESTLSFNETKLNNTIDNRAGGNVNVFDQDLNTTSNVTFDVLNVTTSIFVNGTFDIEHEAIFGDDHALEIDVLANGFGDVKGIFIDFITGAIGPGQDEEAIFINIDNTASTGGDVAGLEVVTTNGSAEVHGYTVGVQVHPVEQLSGIFADMDSALNNSIDVLADFTNPAVNTPIFTTNTETVTIGNDVKFEEIEFILSTFAGGAGIQPVFYFSTGVGTWVEFSPADGTNGMRDTGVIIWLDEDIPSWAVGLNSEFLIRINRTQAGLGTTPITSFVQIASATTYIWDKNGFIKIKNQTIEDWLIVGTGNANASGLSVGDINISGTYYGDGSGITGVSASASNPFNQDLNTTSNVSFGNVSLVNNGWFNGLFNWTINSVSSIYLQFNGGELTFNESQLNATIDDRVVAGSGVFETNATAFWNSTVSQVGIRTATPQAPLHIVATADTHLIRFQETSGAEFQTFRMNSAGDLEIRNDANEVTAQFMDTPAQLQLNILGGLNDADTIIDFGTFDQIDFDAGGIEFLRFIEDAQDITNFNSAGVDIDFLIESAVDAVNFFIDGATGFIGIGTNTPTHKLNVVGNVNITGGMNLSSYLSCTSLETDANGNLLCGTDAGASNPFDQVLNITSNVTFDNMNITNNITVANVDNGICFGSACNASLYWNGTDIRITVT